MLLKEARLAATLRATNHAERAVSNVRQHSLRDGQVILGELLLRHSAFWVQNFVGMRNRKLGRKLGHSLRLAVARARLVCCSLSRSGRPCQRLFRIDCHLAHHFLRRLIFAKSLERCLSHKVVPRPCRESDLCRQHWLHPMCIVTRIPRNLRKWRLLLLQRVQFRAQHPLRLLREPGPCAPGVSEFSALVVSQQQSSDTVSPG